MASYLKRTGTSSSNWAVAAKLNRTTVSRAMKTDFDSVTSINTLDALANAAGIPSVLDFLRAQAVSAELPDFTIETLREALPSLGCNLDDTKINTLSTIMLAARAMIDKAEPDLRGSATFRKAVIAAVIEKTNR